MGCIQSKRSKSSDEESGVGMRLKRREDTKMSASSRTSDGLKSIGASLRNDSDEYIPSSKELRRDGDADDIVDNIFRISNSR